MADRNMSDREIWEMMMKPSVVVDIDSFRHQDIYEKPDASAQSLGTLHGQSQGVKVILIEDDWAKIGAWNHEEAEYVEGCAGCMHHSEYIQQEIKCETGQNSNAEFFAE